MAFITTLTCSKCHKTWQGPKRFGYSETCHECLKKDEDIKRKKHFSGLNGLTLEDRVRRIEEWIYDYKHPINPNDIKF